jgi:putative ABC transport system permease protein
MIGNYLRLAFRNMLRQKSYSFINIAGLAIGMACTILILLWVRDELSYDRFHEHVDRIYRINKTYQMGTETSYNQSTPYPLAEAAKTYVPEIANSTKNYTSRSLVRYKDKVFNENWVCLADSVFFNIFSFKFIKGEAHAALANPRSIVLTETMAQKYFGTDDAMGKTLTINNRDDYTVTGILQNIPSNTEFPYDFFMSITPISGSEEENKDSWESHYLETWVLLHQGANPSDVETKLTAIVKERLDTEQVALKLQPLTKIHLYSIEGKGTRVKYVYFFSLIAFLILAIACINFMNLATARSSKRAKEIGLRKVAGATRTQLASQFLGESFLFSIIAMLVAAFLVELLQPIFNNLTGKHLAINMLDAKFLLGLVAIVTVSGVFSGIYPSIVLSSFEPAKALKGSKNRDLFGAYFRRGLVIIQFSLSIILMIATGIIYSQMKYIQNKDTGFDKENLVYLSLNQEFNQHYDNVKNELLQNPDILGVTRSSSLPSEIWSIVRGIVWEGKQTEEGAAFSFAAVDYDFFEMLDMKMADGRGFSKEFPSDSINYVFNEKAIKIMSMESPVGKRFALNEDETGTIIGVVKDFHSLPLNYEIEPLMVLWAPDYYRYALVKISGNDIKNTIAYLEKTWNKFAPDYPFEYHFLDERFEKVYRDERCAEKLIGYFVILTVGISCLGLFGLALFTAEQRTKEIGVRKVLGATVSGIVRLLSKEFMILVVIANGVAFPIAYYVMNRWLSEFAYRTNIRIEVFLLAAFLSLSIALSTVIFQSLKAALANPVDSLRNE